MFVPDPVFDYRKLAHSAPGRDVRPIHQRLGGLHGTHHDWSKMILTVEAALKIPTTCTGSLIARTTFRDVVPGAASGWADSTRGAQLNSQEACNLRR